MANIPRHYWDSAMWIGLVNRERKRIQDIQYFYDLALNGKAEIWTSTIAHVEVFKLVDEQSLTHPLPKRGLDKIEQALRQDCVKLIPVDLEIAMDARRLRRELKDFRGAGDSIHLASALRWDVDQMLTYDKKHLISQHNLCRCRAGHTLPILEPKQPRDELPLFALES